MNLKKLRKIFQITRIAGITSQIGKSIFQYPKEYKILMCGAGKIGKNSISFIKMQKQNIESAGMVFFDAIKTMKRNRSSRNSHGSNKRI